jgi:hypothetical protein
MRQTLVEVRKAMRREMPGLVIPICGLLMWLVFVSVHTPPRRSCASSPYQASSAPEPPPLAAAAAGMRNAAPEPPETTQ